MTLLGLTVNVAQAQGDTFTEDPNAGDLDETTADFADDNFGDEAEEGDEEEPAIDVDGEDVFATAEEEVNKEAESLAKVEDQKPALTINVPFFIGEDGGPTWIGMTSVIGIIWWFVWGWFVYIPQNISDVTMQYYNWTSGTTEYAVPISWFWSHTQNPTMGWTSAMYLSTFLAYLIVAVPEFVFWMMYLANADMGPWLFKMWATWPAYYGCWGLYIFPIIFAIVQMAQINGDIFAAGWTNSIVQITMHSIVMVFTGVVHILALPSLIKKADEKMDPSYLTMDEKYEIHQAKLDKAEAEKAKLEKIGG